MVKTMLSAETMKGAEGGREGWTDGRVYRQTINGSMGDDGSEGRERKIPEIPHTFARLESPSGLGVIGIAVSICFDSSVAGSESQHAGAREDNYRMDLEHGCNGWSTGRAWSRSSVAHDGAW